MATSYARNFQILNLRQIQLSTPILPVMPNSPPTTLSLLTHNHQSSNPPSSSSQHPDLDYVAQLQRLEGPWNLSFDMPIPPKNSSGLHFTYDRRPESPVEIEHSLMIDITVSVASSSSQSDQRDSAILVDGVTSDGHFETITITTPIHILSVSYTSSSTNFQSQPC